MIEFRLLRHHERDLQKFKYQNRGRGWQTQPRPRRRGSRSTATQNRDGFLRDLKLWNVVAAMVNRDVVVELDLKRG